jgi:pimeloyl-ACP methyl ester carboxylesterase
MMLDACIRGSSCLLTAIAVRPGDSWTLAADSTFLTTALPSLSRSDPSSPVYGAISDVVALGGHSMGGGTTLISADDAGQNSKAVVMLAPGTYTIPPAQPHAKKVTGLDLADGDEEGMAQQSCLQVLTPGLTMVGSHDCVNGKVRASVRADPGRGPCLRSLSMPRWACSTRSRCTRAWAPTARSL